MTDYERTTPSSERSAARDGEVSEERHPAVEIRAEAGSPAHEEEQSLWLLTVSPLIWATHFLVSYVGGALWCARVAGPLGGLGPVRLGVLAATGVALAGIAVAGVAGYRRHDYGLAEVPHDFDTPGDRHRFLGFATVLLSVLSAIAVCYVAAVVLFVETCA